MAPGNRVVLKKTSSGGALNIYRPGAIKISNGVRGSTPLLGKKMVVPMKAETIQIMTTVSMIQDYFQQRREEEISGLAMEDQENKAK